jgi:hypothetical protein
MAHGAWPPASPWVWKDSWWNGNAEYSVVLSFRFDSPVNGGGTNQLQGCDYDLDPDCPWKYLIIVRATDNARLVQKIPSVSRTGTITAQQLHNFGLDLFTDIGSVTVGVSP